jgi:hypothetical protein
MERDIVNFFEGVTVPSIYLTEDSNKIVVPDNISVKVCDDIIVQYLNDKTF